MDASLNLLPVTILALYACTDSYPSCRAISSTVSPCSEMTVLALRCKYSAVRSRKWLISCLSIMLPGTWSSSNMLARWALSVRRPDPLSRALTLAAISLPLSESSSEVPNMPARTIRYQHAPSPSTIRTRIRRSCSRVDTMEGGRPGNKRAQ